MMTGEERLIATLTRVMAERDTALGDLAAARADAARYRWLRSTDAFAVLNIAWRHPAAVAVGADCDKAIDAALAGKDAT